ncbi:MAG: hypothetical protein WCX88_02475 [Patescibacteria group bacterium]
MPQAVPFNVLSGANAIDKSVQKYFLKESTPELQLKKFMNFRTTTDYYDKDAGISGLSEASFTAENANIKKDVPIETYKKTYTQEQIDIEAPFSYISWKFAIKKRDVSNIVKSINNSLNRKKEKLAAERLVNGFDATYTHYDLLSGNKTITITGGDSLEAFTTAHTREDGGTNMNNVVYDGTTYSLPFDYAGYKAAIRTASLMVDPRGNPYPANLDTLVCKKGSSVSFKAKEILAAIKNGKIPESFDNDGAGVPPFKIIELDYLTSDAYWYMFDSSRALTDSEGFQFIESEGNNVDPVHVNPYNRQLSWFGHSLCALGHNDVARCFVASAGDSSTT